MPSPRRPSQTAPPADVVTKQTLVGAVVLTALITTIIAAFVISAVVERGREGPSGPAGASGPAGEEGPRGERGPTSQRIRSTALVEAIRADPTAFEEAASEALGGLTDPAEPADDFGDSDPSVLQNDLDSVRDDVQALCDALRSSGNVTTDDLPC